LVIATLAEKTDSDLLDVAVATDNETHIIHTTGGHLFWNAKDQEWTHGRRPSSRAQPRRKHGVRNR
jgi:hypothetical protein